MTDDPKLLYWTGALVNLAIIVGCGTRGIRAIRRREVRTHRRMMLVSSALVGVFLTSYVLKVGFLGKEDRSAWTALDHGVLYTHELCIAAMLLGGGFALYRAWRFRAQLGPGPTLPPGSATLEGRTQHRRAGRIASWAGLFAFLTALGVWAGMLARS